MKMDHETLDAEASDVEAGSAHAVAPTREVPRDCVICLEALLSRDHTVLPCNHYFHTDCLREWQNVKRECPMCRASDDVAPADGHPAVRVVRSARRVVANDLLLVEHVAWRTPYGALVFLSYCNAVLSFFTNPLLIIWATMTVFMMQMPSHRMLAMGGILVYIGLSAQCMTEIDNGHLRLVTILSMLTCALQIFILAHLARMERRNSLSFASSTARSSHDDSAIIEL